MTKLNKSSRLLDLTSFIPDIKSSYQLSNLADQYKISVKTLRRDLTQLIDEHNAPITIENNRIIPQKDNPRILINGYWFEPKIIETIYRLSQISNHLPNELFRYVKNQLFDLNQTVQKLDTVHRLPSEPSNSYSQHVKIVPNQHPKIKKSVFKTIFQALIQEKQLHIQYWKRNPNQQSERTISPQRLIYYKNEWYLDSYCHTRQDIRTFALIAIQQIETLPNSSQQVDKQQLAEHYQQTYGIFAGKSKAIATIQFSPMASRYVANQQWHPEQQHHWIDNQLQLSIPYNNPTELIADILKWGSEAEILSPSCLRQQICEEIKKLTKKY